MKKQLSNSLATSHGQGEHDLAKIATLHADSAGKRYQVIKLAIDAHSKFYMVARQLDNARPQPPQKFTREELLKFVGKQLLLADKVYTCYEAGCFGFGLHRELTALGAANFVIAPQNWDARCERVKTDRTDARAMLNNLGQYLQGHTKALSVVRVPTKEEELRRGRARQRGQFQNHLRRWINQGKSLLLYHGLHVGWSWWQEGHYAHVQKLVRKQLGESAAAVLVMLDDYRQMAVQVSEKFGALTREVVKTHQEQTAKKVAGGKAPTGRLRGLGDLSAAKLAQEICDWSRFTNRRQVSSYTGLCPGVSGSGGKFRGLSVTKHGNPRLRATLVELAWLMYHFQPNYRGVRKWKKVLSGKNRSARKKAIVAVARQLAVDLWRMETGRSTPAKLGLEQLKRAA